MECRLSYRVGDSRFGIKHATRARVRRRGPYKLPRLKVVLLYSNEIYSERPLGTSTESELDHGATPSLTWSKMSTRNAQSSIFIGVGRQARLDRLCDGGIGAWGGLTSHRVELSGVALTTPMVGKWRGGGWRVGGDPGHCGHGPKCSNTWQSENLTKCV